jgi:hypothetical protein
MSFGIMLKRFYVDMFKTQVLCCSKLQPGESGNISSAGCLGVPKRSNDVILIFSISRTLHLHPPGEEYVPS